MDNKTIIGITSIVFSLVGYIPYFRDIFRKKTKPHVFSWLGWSLIGSIAFFAQISEGAGPGAWAGGFGAMVCLSITLLAISHGEKTITLSDWVAFGGALIGLTLWKLTDDPLLAIILITITDALAFVPTFRKGYSKPYEETVITWIFSSVKFIISLFAIESYGLSTLLYPIYLILSNGSFGIMLLVRRKMLSKAKNIEQEKNNYV